MTADRMTPCELCGADEGTACACPPCPCIWCRFERGEVTEAESRRVKANIKAHAMADARRSLRERAGQ